MTVKQKAPPKKAAPKKKAPARSTFVALVLDESGSMGSMRDAAIELFNTQAAAIQKTAASGGATKVSLFKFGCHEEPHTTEVFHAKAAADVPTLTRANYEPQNGTPMRDGIGLAISRLEAEDDGGKDTAFLVVIVTDGQENQSRLWSADRLQEKVNALQATGRWTFAVYGANISLHDLHTTTGFNPDTLPMDNFASYVPNSGGVVAMAAASSGHLQSYMGTREKGLTASRTFAAPQDDVEVDMKVRFGKGRLPK